MHDVLKFIGEQISGYTIFLLLLSALMLIFMDARQLAKAGLKMESGFSFIVGVIYTAASLIFFIITQFFAPIR